MKDDQLIVSDQPNPLDAETVRAIEAIILVAVEPVPSEQLAQLLEQPVVVIDRLCAELADAYAEAGHGFQLAKVAGGYRYQTHPDLSPYVERFLLDGQRARMSGAALETLAIIAYKQPLSRAQIAAIRGVNVDGVMRTLQQRGYIAEVGKDPGPGNPSMFGTTSLFLEKVGLNDVSELPSLGDFIPGADVVEMLEHGLRAAPESDAGAEGATAEAATADAEAADAEAPPTPDGAVADGDAAEDVATDGADGARDGVEAIVDVTEERVIAVEDLSGEDLPDDELPSGE